MNTAPWKIYLAAGYDQQERMRGYRKLLESRGNYIVTSRWIDEEGPAMRELETAADWDAANLNRIMDLDDIDEAEYFVIFTDTPSTSGGRHTELGYALASRKVIAIVGTRENVFQVGEEISHFTTWDEFFNSLPF